MPSSSLHTALLGIDFSSAPTRRKPITVALGQRQGQILRLERLLAFETVDARAAKVVELRFFGGLENEEIAQALGLSLATVKRDWTLARAWLHRALGEG